MAEDEEDDVVYIDSTKLREVLREQSDDLQVSSDAAEYLEHQLGLIESLIWEEAVNDTMSQGKKRVEQETLENAFLEVFRPYHILEEAAARLGQYQAEINRTANQSPILDLDFTEDE